MQFSKKSFLFCLLTLFTFAAHSDVNMYVHKKKKLSKALMATFAASYVLPTLIRPTKTHNNQELKIDIDQNIFLNGVLCLSEIISNGLLIKIFWDLQNQKSDLSRGLDVMLISIAPMLKSLLIEGTKNNNGYAMEIWTDQQILVYETLKSIGFVKNIWEAYSDLFDTEENNNNGEHIEDTTITL